MSERTQHFHESFNYNAPSPPDFHSQSPDNPDDYWSVQAPRTPPPAHGFWSETGQWIPYAQASPLPHKVMPLSPQLTIEVESPGLETAREMDSGKEVIPPSEAPIPVEPRETKGGRRICGMRTRWFFLALLLLLLVVIAVAVPVGVVMGRKSDSASRPSTPAPGEGQSGYYNPAWYSMTGAFNGTGIALASQSFDKGGHGRVVMYFQHHTGQIRYTQLSDEGDWIGGSVNEIVAVDAKNATPIAAVSYAKDEQSTWHIFYIDRNNTVRQRSNNNNTNIWSDGPLNDLNLKAMDDPTVGLQACWYGSVYGDAVYDHSPIPGIAQNVNASDLSVGMHLWYGVNDTAFNEVGWTYGDTKWQQQQYFNGFNGHAGVGCYSWGPGSVSYVFMMNLKQELEIWWKDLNTSLSGNASHPINEWVKAPVTIPTYEHSSVGYTNFLYVQNPELGINGYNISWNAEQTSIVQEDSFTIQGPVGLPNTHLSVTALPNDSGGDSLLVFYQTNGTDVTQFVRDFTRGQWTSTSVPIPQS